MSGITMATMDIGEYLMYGRAVIEHDNNANITIKLCDYKTNNVREEKTFSFVDKFKIQEWLWDYTTDYYVEKILEKIYV
jgi:hypothetical protein